MAHGLRVADPGAVVIVLCGDAFAYRSCDQLNAMAQSEDNIVVYSVQAGLSGARDGATHQSSGQPGAILTMPNVRLFEVCGQGPQTVTVI